MRRFLFLGLIGIVLVVSVLLALRGGSGVESAPYSATMLDGEQPVSLRGKPALLSSWATWCSECQHELPSLERLWQERKPQGLQVVAVNIDVDGTNPGIHGMIANFKLTMPIWHDSDNVYSAVFAAPGVPTSVLLDARGQVVKTWIGRTDFQSAEVAAAIDGLLTD